MEGAIQRGGTAALDGAPFAGTKLALMRVRAKSTASRHPRP